MEAVVVREEPALSGRGSKFVIFAWIEILSLGSYLLAIVRRRVPGDWSSPNGLIHREQRVITVLIVTGEVATGTARRRQMAPQGVTRRGNSRRGALLQWC